eukprot:gene8253-16973_t
MATDNRTLPKKEYDLFRSLVKFYETKQYKKGIKTADIVLKKYPNHGETLAMKGVILNSLEKKEEAYDLVKKGLKNDVRSHVCWHVFGLLHRSDRNYKEAIKCYLNALRIDNDNQQILRDLSWLQVQMRDNYGFIETRRKLLVLKPNVRLQWVTYAIANFVAGEFSIANDVISKYLESSSDKELGYEFSEIILFQNRCLESAGQYDNALIHLEKNEMYIVDKLAIHIQKATLFIKLGNFSEARKQWMNLVRQQTENYRFHCGLQVAILELDTHTTQDMFALKALGLPCNALELDDAQLAKLAEVYKNRLPKSRAAGKISLDLLRGDDFQLALDEYLKKSLRDGLPALYNDVCALIRKPDPSNGDRKVFVKDPSEFRNHPVMQIALDLVVRYISNLESNGTFISSPSAEDVQEVPTALLWALYLHSHLLEMCGRLNEALAVIEAAITHTPTALDMRCKKAKILKKCGDFQGAAIVMEECRVLDLQDRYLNNKTTKYLLRADCIEQAMDTIALFTKHDGDPQQALFDLQCIWYEIEVAESYARKKDFGPALKKFYAIEKHFLDFIEDQFDFHGFAMRKSTLRAYIDMISMEDNLFNHKFFQRATRGAIRTWLAILDKPTESADDDEQDLSHLNAAERKKERAKQRKVKSKAAAVAAAKEAEEAKAKAAALLEEKRSGKSTAVKDEDPIGEKILVKEPLDELARWAEEASRSLVAGGGGGSTNKIKADPDTQALICEVCFRRGKYVLAMKALCAGLRTAPMHPELTFQLLRLAQRIRTDSSIVIKPVVLEVLQDELVRLLNGQDTSVFATQYAQQVRELGLGLPHRTAAARCLVLIDSSDVSKMAASRLLDAEEDQDVLWGGKGVLLANVIDAHKFFFPDRFLIRAKIEFPLANAFGGGMISVIPDTKEECTETDPRPES